MTRASLDLLLYVGGALLSVGVVTVALLGFSPGGPLLARWSRYTAWLDRQARDLFLDVTGRDMAFGQVIGAALAIALAGVYDDRALLALPFVLLAPRVALTIARRRRREEIETQLNGWLLMLANMLKVTGSLSDALSHTADLTRGPLGQEIDLLLKEQRVGAPLGDALRNMGARVGSPTLSSVITIMLIGRTAGGELPSLLEETASAIRERMRLEAVVRKQTAMGRAQMVVLFLGPPVIVYMFRRVEPDFFEPLFNSGVIGYGLAGVALVFWAASLILARRILAVEV